MNNSVEHNGGGIHAAYSTLCFSGNAGLNDNSAGEGIARQNTTLLQGILVEESMHGIVFYVSLELLPLQVIQLAMVEVSRHGTVILTSLVILLSGTIQLRPLVEGSIQREAFSKLLELIQMTTL